MIFVILVVAVAIEHLDFKTVTRGMTFQRSAQSDAVVSSVRELELNLDDAVLVLLFAQQVAALLWFADNRSVLDFVVVHGVLPIA